MIFLLCALAYFIGAIPTAVLLGRSRNINPLAEGDRNPGWWNMRRLAGRRTATIVLIADVLKGFVPTLLAVLLTDVWWMPYLVGLVAMVGHAFPVFTRFKGGRSILTFAGAMAAITPEAVALALLIGALLGAVVRRFDLPSFDKGLQMAMGAYPFCQALFTPLTHVAAAGVLMTFIGMRFIAAGKSDRAKSEPVATSH